MSIEDVFNKVEQTVHHAAQSITGATSVEVAPDRAGGPLSRIGLYVSLDDGTGDVALWVKEEASGSAVQAGILLIRNNIPDVVNVPFHKYDFTDMPQGPISVIIDNAGSSYDVYVTERLG